MLQCRAQYQSLAQFGSADTSDWDVEEATHQSLKIFFIFFCVFHVEQQPSTQKIITSYELTYFIRSPLKGAFFYTV